jgi:CelD/BcsL family acetyltransferase involved in cellulose biosynthesis
MSRNNWSSATGAAVMLSADGTSNVSDKTKEASAVCYEVDPLGDERWASLVKTHPRASVFHSANWLKTLRNVYDYEPVVITTCPPGARLTNGLVFCWVNSWLTGRRLVSLPFSDHSDPLIDRTDALDAILAHAQRHVDQKRSKYIEIRPLSCQPSSHTKLGKLLTYRFHHLDLGRSEQELFRSFHKDCVQRKIRRAEREKLQYELGTSEDLLQKFYQLLVMTRRRQYLPPQPLAWFRGLIAAFGTDLTIRVASKDGSPVAAILTLSHKKTMVYKYGCSDAAFNKFGGMALLFWKAIREAREKGFEELDLGRSDIDNLGLIAFKEHWGAAATDLNYWVYPGRSAKRPSSWGKNLVARVVSVAPDFALKVVGKLLYRHIG